MKYLSKFENFDFGHRFSHEEEELKPVELDDPTSKEEEFTSQEDAPDDAWSTPEESEEECKPCSDTEDGDDEDEKSWGDENELRLEKVSSFRQFEAKKEKGESYKKSGLKHPEKADLNKDKKISGYEKTRGKAVQKAVQGEKEEGNDKKSNKKEEKEEKGGKGLTAAQKKLPEGLRKAIEAKNKKK